MISVIIPIAGNRHTDNLGLVDLVLQQQTFKNYELIIIEQIKKDEKSVYHDFHTGKYLSVVNPINDLFHRNWLMNVGANMAVGEKLLFMDADIFFGADYLEKIHNFDKPWFVAWSELHYLNKATTDELIKNGKPADRNYEGLPMKSDPYCAAGGSVCVDRMWFHRVFGGLNENYFGWGAEDNDSAIRAMAITKEFGQLKYTIYHLHHEDDRLDNINKCSSPGNQHQWQITQRYTSEVTKRLLNAEIGNPEGPTLIDVKDLKV